MIDLYYWPTPNGHKVPIMLEECGLEYETHPINMLKGDQFDEAYLKVNPNNKIPAIVDQDGPGGKPYTVFESGAVLLYLADKTKRFIPQDEAGRFGVIQWLFFQMANVGPMFGQAGHFRFYASEPVPYGKERYYNEMLRLYGVLDRRLAEHEYVAGEYSIADMAIWPWVITYKRQEVKLEDFPNVRRWYKQLQSRPALRRGYEVGREFGKPDGNWDEEARKNLLANPNPSGA